jgi:HAD superfamily hydrolase (TIGR01549 family)
MNKCFIFDMDGTLIDSNDFHAMAWQKALESKGKIVPLQKIRPHIGKGADQLLPVFLSQEEMEKFGEDLDELQGQIFKRYYLVQVRPFPKVRELFKAIREADGKIALASSSDKADLKDYETIAQISDLVEHCASSDDAQKSKPAPDIFRAALRDLGNPGKDSVIVAGDTPHDAVTARKAGIAIVGVLSGGFSKADLTSRGCFAVYEDAADILANLPSLLKR